MVLIVNYLKLNDYPQFQRLPSIPTISLYAIRETTENDEKPAPEINPEQALIVKSLKYCVFKVFRQNERTHILLEYEFFYGKYWLF